MSWIEESHQGVTLRIKAVPRARADAIGGLRGDRLKIRVAAPPEGGRANLAIVALLARTLEVRNSDVDVIQGMTSPEKTITIRGVSLEYVRQRLLGDEL